MSKLEQKTPAGEPKERDPLSLFIQQSKSFVEQYFKPVLIILILGVALFGLSLFTLHWREQKNKQTEEALYQSRKKLTSAEKQAGGDILSFDRGQNFFSQSKTGEYNSTLNTLAKEYTHLIKQHIKQPSGLLAVPQMARFLYQYDQKKEAIDLLKKADTYKKANLIGFLNSFQLGSYLLDQKEYETAIKSFLFITTNKQAKWLWPKAFIKLGLSYEGQNKIEQAKSAYKQAKNIDSSSQQAEQYLNLLNLQQKLKVQNAKK